MGDTLERILSQLRQARDIIADTGRQGATVGADALEEARQFLRKLDAPLGDLVDFLRRQAGGAAALGAQDHGAISELTVLHNDFQKLANSTPLGSRNMAVGVNWRQMLAALAAKIIAELLERLNENRVAGATGATGEAQQIEGGDVGAVPPGVVDPGTSQR